MALREGTGAGRQVRLDHCFGRDPVGQSIFAVLDDSLAGIVSVIGLAGLARSNRSVIDQVQEVLAVTGNDSHLLAVLTECIELVLEGSLDLLTGDVRELGLRYKGLGLGTNQLLLEDNNAG